MPPKRNRATAAPANETTYTAMARRLLGTNGIPYYQIQYDNTQPPQVAAPNILYYSPAPEQTHAFPLIPIAATPTPSTMLEQELAAYQYPPAPPQQTHAFPLIPIAATPTPSTLLDQLLTVYEQLQVPHLSQASFFHANPNLPSNSEQANTLKRAHETRIVRRFAEKRPRLNHGDRSHITFCFDQAKCQYNVSTQAMLWCEPKSNYIKFDSSSTQDEFNIIENDTVRGYHQDLRRNMFADIKFSRGYKTESRHDMEGPIFLSPEDYIKFIKLQIKNAGLTKQELKTHIESVVKAATVKEVKEGSIEHILSLSCERTGKEDPAINKVRAVTLAIYYSLQRFGYKFRLNQNDQDDLLLLDLKVNESWLIKNDGSKSFSTNIELDTSTLGLLFNYDKKNTRTLVLLDDVLNMITDNPSIEQNPTSARLSI